MSLEIPMSIVLIVCVVVAIFVWLITWLVTRTQSQKKIFSLEKENEVIKSQNINLEQALKQTQDIDARFAHVFKSLSAQSLQDNSNMYLQQTREQMRGFVEPLMQNIQKLETHVQNVEKTREGAYSQLLTKIHGLGGELSNLNLANQELRSSTEKLHGALRSDTATRGKWGEIQLRRIVEMAGMVSHIDFEEQVHTSHAENNQRPDMVINLPHEGLIPVDAKVPMNAYLEACACKDIDKRNHLLEQHKVALKKHIKDLSSKQYWQQFDNAAQLVILFVPYESGLEISLSTDPTLLDEALERKVIVTGPSTLYAFLKVISYGWMQVELSKNASEIAQASKDLLQRFNIFYEHFSKLGKKINETVRSFNESANSLSTRFIPKMREIKELRGDKEDFKAGDNSQIFIDTNAQE